MSHLWCKVIVAHENLDFPLPITHAHARTRTHTHTHTQPGDAQVNTELEIHSRLLDILALLLARGVDPAVPDLEGNTASAKASKITSREECFLDGAVLLGT